MNDPWSITEAQLSSDTLITNTNIENLKPKNDPWSLLDSSYTLTQSPKSNEFNGALSETYHSEQEQSKPELMGSQRPNSKTPEGFLGENSLLVNLENLMGPASRPAKPGKFSHFSNFHASCSSYSSYSNRYLLHTGKGHTIHLEIIKKENLAN